jgi:hypothetical protein
MKKILLIILLMSTFSCKKSTEQSPYAYNESTIFSDNNKALFTEFLMEIKPYILVGGVKKYVVSDSIFNVTIKTNADTFGINNSLRVDTNALSNQTSGAYRVTSDDFKYPTRVVFKTDKNIATTAGEYGQLLNRTLVLAPAFYYVNISSFEIKQANGVKKKVSSLAGKTVEVKDGMKNMFLGEFEILVK